MGKGSDLDSMVMSQLLKGDAFPDDDLEAFMDHSIKTYFDALFSQTGQSKSAVIQEANISRTYGYQIINGTRIAQRDYYLRIAIAMKLDLRTTQRLLAFAQAGALYPLIKRDAAIIFAINHGYDTMQTYDLLHSLDLEPLERDEMEQDTDPDKPDE